VTAAVADGKASPYVGRKPERRLDMSLSSTDITVVIPVYNGALYLVEAVESVRRQSLPVGRIILVDDGSTDATPEIAAALCGEGRHPPVQCVRQDNKGPASAMNHGVTLADSTLLAFQSADDIWVPDKIAWQMRALDDGADLVFGHLQNFISPELDAATAATLRCPPDPMPAYSAGSLLTRLGTFRKVGPLNEGFRIGEFIDWYGRAKDLGLTSVMLPDVVSMRRLHGKNHSLSRKVDPTGYAHVLKAMMDRRRGQTRPS
jgi:glycosyltransferase involved in cell wall biosynthesis